MSYYFSKTIDTNWDDARERIAAALKAEGFGILTEINMQTTLKAKIDADIKPYTILGACHPASAYEAVKAESHIGTMLPCNVIMRETDEGKIEIAAVDPVASMQAVKNDKLGGVATEVRNKLQRVIESL